MTDFPARYAVCTRTQFGRDVRGYFPTFEQARLTRTATSPTFGLKTAKRQGWGQP